MGKTPVNSTIGDLNLETPLPCTKVDPPTLAVNFCVNDSPLSGKEGKALPGAALWQRLEKEVETNVSLKIFKTNESNSFEVRGRGELQIGILVETMRREGLEFQVTSPQVLYKTEGGKKLEPIEEVVVDVEEEYSGVVIEKLSKRKAEMQKMSNVGHKLRIVFKCPTRGLLGYQSEFKNDTRGTGVLTHSLLEYAPHKGKLEGSRKGCIISMADGQTTSHALTDLEARGTIFVEPGSPVYEGMVIGEALRIHDLDVNPTKQKQVSNYRVYFKEDFSKGVSSKTKSFEDYLSYMNEDEMIEVTPTSIRLRKVILNCGKRRHANKNKK